MNQLKILPPEKARAKARAKVAEFQCEKRKHELRAKRKPPAKYAAEAERIMRLSQEQKNQFLWIASARGNTIEVEDLIEGGADINSQNHDGKTALVIAAEKGQPMVCIMLADGGADLNATDKDGLTALDHAFMRGNKNTAMILIEKGAKAAAQLG
jgi:ankyrin repeat protein